LFVFAIVAVCVYADCNKYTVKVNDSISLQQALNEAKPGATISVAPGTYTGPFMLKVSGEPDCPITVTASDNKHSPVLTSSESCVLTMDIVSYVTVSQLTFENSTTYGVRMLAANNNVLDHLSFHGFPDCAVYMPDSSYNYFYKNRFSDIGDPSSPGDYGYCFWLGAEGFDCINNTIEACDFGNNLHGDAILLDALSHDNTVLKNTFSGTGSDASYFMRVTGYLNNIVGNTFHNVDNTKMEGGIYCHGSANVFKGNGFVLKLDKYCILEGGNSDQICASNKYQDARALTNGKIDQSC